MNAPDPILTNLIEPVSPEPRSFTNARDAVDAIEAL